MANLFEQLGLDWRTLLVNATAFVVLVLILKKFLFGPVSRILAEREGRVRETVTKMEEDRQAMEQTRADYEKRIAEIEQEARRRIQEAMREAGHIRDELISEARAQAERIIERGRQEIEREKEKAIVEVRDTVADLAIGAARKVLERNLDEATHHKLVSDFIEGMEEH